MEKQDRKGNTAITIVIYSTLAMQQYTVLWIYCNDSTDNKNNNITIVIQKYNSNIQIQ